MKKVTALFLVLACCFGVTACRSDDNGTSSLHSEATPSNSIPSSSVEPEQTESDRNEESFDEEYVSVSKYYVDYNTSRRKAEKNTSFVFYSSGEDAFQIIWSFDNNQYSGSAADILKTVDYWYITNEVDKYVNADFSSTNKDYSIFITEDKNISMNNIEFYNFAGYITDANDQKCDVYGYSFVMNSSPCIILGYETDSTKLETFISEIDAVAASVRTER